MVTPRDILHGMCAPIPVSATHKAEPGGAVATRWQLRSGRSLLLGFPYQSSLNRSHHKHEQAETAFI